MLVRSCPKSGCYCFWWGDTVGYQRNKNNNGRVAGAGGALFEFSSGDGNDCSSSPDSDYSGSARDLYFDSDNFSREHNGR
ncbi:MAG: hypothetical protein ACI4QT_08265 [Kiritimatiellia bacterium]